MTVPTPEPSISSFTVGAEPRFHHVTVTTNQALTSEQGVRSLFRAALGALPPDARRVHAKVFAAKPGAAVVRSVLADLGCPTTLVLDEPCVGGLLAGVQLLAVEGAARCETVALDGRPVGTLVAFDGVQMLHLSSMGTAPDRAGPPRLEDLFERASDGVQAFGFGFRDVARTWIYVQALLDDYAELNRVRNQFFVREGIGGPPGSPPPASTGIQGAHATGAPGFMDLVAVRGAGILEPMRTSHQCEAYDYGSAFSRGTIVRLPGQRLLFASGTASIDDSGATVHVGDPRGQILESYAAMDTLLRHQGATLADTVSGVLFFKDPQTHRAWKELRARGEVPDLPAVAVFADVCRSDLLFELEITAATGVVRRSR
jgi:enamine deaminase RidA (YjgF/YER057c/UK114 family)